MYKDFIEQKIIEHEDGLSRGLDNDIKFKCYNEVVSIMRGIRVNVWYTLLNQIRPDHYVTFLANNRLYVYSQPYGDLPADHHLPYRWEIEYYNDTSWYYPDSCVTVVYSRPVDDLYLYRSKVDEKIWVFPEKLDRSDMSYKKLKEVDDDMV